MANLNLEDFSEDFREVAPKECAMYLVSCLDKETQTRLKQDWKNVGGVKAIPYWQYCLENIEVIYKLS